MNTSQAQSANAAPIELSGEYSKKARSLVFKDVMFASRGERACAIMLSKYIEGWKPVEGQTVEVRLAFGRSADFKIGNVILEWHPICRRWEHDSEEAYKLIERGLQRCCKESKKKIREGLELEFRARYEKKRQFGIDYATDPEIRGCHLLVCSTAEEFCKALKSMSGTRKSLKNIISEFNNAKRATGNNAR